MPKKRGQRDNTTSNTPIANPRLLDPITIRHALEPLRHLHSLKNLIDVEDRRRFSPAGHRRSARTLAGGHHRLKVSKPGKMHTFSPTVSFVDPKRVVVCVRRKTRAEVLHAKKKTGRGSRRKSPKRNWYSSISCKG